MSEEFRQFVRENISASVVFDTPYSFKFRLSFEDYLVTARPTVTLLKHRTGRDYRSTYDFNLKQAIFAPW